MILFVVRTVRIEHEFQAAIPFFDPDLALYNASAHGLPAAHNTPTTTSDYTLTTEEQDAFDLALYVFDKNFNEINAAFLNCIPVSVLQRHYLQSYKGSESHKRWKKWRKSFKSHLRFHNDIFTTKFQEATLAIAVAAEEKNALERVCFMFHLHYFLSFPFYKYGL